jgi:hypothetical protein
MSQRPTHDAEASTSRVVPLAPDIAVSQPEQGLCCPRVSRALLDEVLAEQALWQEFREHDASLNTALTEVMRLHGGRHSSSLRRVFLLDSSSLSRLFLV